MGTVTRGESIDWRSAGEFWADFQGSANFMGKSRQGPKDVQFQVYGRLEYLRKSSDVIDAYLKSMEKWTPKPYWYL